MKVIYADGSSNKLLLTGNNYLLTNNRTISKIEIAGQFIVDEKIIDINAIIKVIM